jgi:hypothetical protein
VNPLRNPYQMFVRIYHRLPRKSENILPAKVSRNLTDFQQCDIIVADQPNEQS